MLSFTIGRASITVFIDGEFNTIDKSHINYEPLLEELRKEPEDRDLEAIKSMTSVIKMIEMFTTGKVTVFEDAIHYDGVAVNNYMTQRMVEIIQQGVSIEPWARFMDNVFQNPAEYARHELYEWMEKANMPITPDGCFLAFKKVRRDFTDCHTGKFDNSPGTILEMPREKCDPVRTNHCSTGFHFCSVGYLGSFGGQRVVVVKINPKHVTSIPNDYKFTKGRTCRYEVIAELSRESAAHHKAWLTGMVDLENPTEFPADILAQIKFPEDEDTVTIDEAVEDALIEIEEAQTDAGKADETVPFPGHPPVVLPEPTDKVRIPTTVTQTPVASKLPVGLATTVRFETSDGREFDAATIKAALEDASIRGAARNLGIQDSTLRGWKKRLGL